MQTKRFVGIKPMVGAKVDGELVATPVVIEEVGGESVSYALANDDEIAAFLVGKLPIEWRGATVNDDPKTLVTRWVKVRKGSKVADDALTRDGEEGLERCEVAIKFDGIRSGDTVVVLASSRGTIMLRTLAKRAVSESLELFQVHTMHLHQARVVEEPTDEQDARTLLDIVRIGKGGAYRVRTSDASASALGSLFAARQRMQKIRIAHGNRVRNTARELHLAMKMAKEAGEVFDFDRAVITIGAKPNARIARRIVERDRLLVRIRKEATDANINQLGEISEEIARLSVNDRYAATLKDAKKYLSSLERGEVPGFEEVFDFTKASDATWAALDAEEDRIETEMLERMNEMEIGRRLLSIKGIGPAIGGGIVGLILDPRRFDREANEEEGALKARLDKLLTDASYEDGKKMLGEFNPDAINPKKTSGFDRIVNVRKFYLEELGDTLNAGLLQEALECLKELRRFDRAHKAKGRLRSYAGCAPHGGEFFRSRRKTEGKDFKSCNRDLRQRLYQLAAMWIKRYKNPGDWEWAHKLNENIAYYRRLHPEAVQVPNKAGNKMVWRYKDGHIIKMASWRTISQFLDWLYDTWREAQVAEENELLKDDLAA